MSIYRTYLIVCLAAVMTAAVGMRVAFAQEKKEGNKTELHKHMEEMDESLKKLRRSIRAADQNTESLSLIAKVQAAAVASKAMTPSMTTTIPEADRAKFVSDYRKQMADVIITLCDMEKAIIDGKNDQAQELFKKIKSQEDKGHEKFTKE